MITVRIDRLVGITEIAERADVTRQVVHNWRVRWDDFPSPIVMLACGPIFDWRAVERWLHTPHEREHKSYKRHGRPVRAHTVTLAPHASKELS